jgi:hypothetical protein
VGDHASLAATGSGKDQQRAVLVQHRLALGVRQIFQKVFHSVIYTRFGGLFGVRRFIAAFRPLCSFSLMIDA